MAIPRRKIDAELHTFLATSLSQFAHDVALALLIWAVLDTIVGIFSRPQTKAVMMLGGEDDTLHSACLQGINPLVDITIAERRIEQVDRIIAITPLYPILTIERIGTIMDEGIRLHTLPSHLLGGGHRQNGLRWVYLGKKRHMRHHRGNDKQE